MSGRRWGVSFVGGPPELELADEPSGAVRTGPRESHTHQLLSG